jgi:RNA polymerase sigma factor (sigma-70 family)
VQPCFHPIPFSPKKFHPTGATFFPAVHQALGKTTAPPMQQPISWEKIYFAEAPKLLGLCRRYVQDVAVAEDLLHDAFLTALHKQADFEGRGAPAAWLRTIAVNTALQYLRREKRLQQLLAAAPAEEMDLALPDDATDLRSVVLAADFSEADLLAAIDSLPEHHKVVFNLYVLEGYSHQQIGDTLGISPGTSKSHLARARKKIQHLLWVQAQQMQKKQRRAALVPLLPDPTDPLDDLFRQRLQEHAIQPSHLPAGLQQALQQAPPLPPPTPVVAGVVGKSAVAWVAGTLTTVAVAAVVGWSQMSPGGATAAAPAVTAVEILDTAAELATIDTMSNTYGQIPPTVSQHPATKNQQSSINNQQSLPPVVVNKTVVVKDTVFQEVDDHE